MSDGPQPQLPLGDVRMTLLDKLIRFCLENKLVVALIVLFAVAWGIRVAPFDWEVPGLPRDPVPTDAIPDIGENQQIVFTRWMGRSPQDVEDQITYPLTVALLGIPEVKTVRSISMFGFSSIYVIFNEKADFYWSRSRVLEKLSSLPANSLPDGVRPALGPDATALGQIYWYTLEGRDPDGSPAGGWDLHELRTIQDWQVRYSLLAAEGISEVASIGGFVQEYQIDVDPDAMRAHGVSLEQVFMAVKMSNVDVGARTIEVNKVEYVIRGLGFIEEVRDIELSVVKVNDNVPIYVKDIATVSLGPALRRGALDKDGAEAVGAVAVVRYGFNPLAAIKNIKKKIAEIAPGLPTKAIIDWDATTRAEVEEFAGARGFGAFAGPGLDQDGWLEWLRATPRDDWPDWVTTSQVTVVSFYDRTGLIYETLGTLNTALTEEILVTIIVVIVSVLHLRSSILISGALPLAVLMCFIAMKGFGVDANIVALSGIAIAIGTIVDMSIIVCENILKHLDDAPPEADRLEVVYLATSEVGSAVVTAVLTTIISFLPVFAMIGQEGKLFKPLAFTKTFALLASVVAALAIVPPAAHVLFAGKTDSKGIKRVLLALLGVVGLGLGLLLGYWVAAVILLMLSGYHLVADYLPPKVSRVGPWVASAVAVLIVGVYLSQHWMPLGPEKGLGQNLTFVAVLIGGLLGFFTVFRYVYGPILRWCLAHKLIFLSVPLVLIVLGGYSWLGVEPLFGPIGRVSPKVYGTERNRQKLLKAGLVAQPDEDTVWSAAAARMKEKDFRELLDEHGIEQADSVFKRWSFVKLAGKKWKEPDFIRDKPLRTRVRWTLAKSWGGLGKEFMPPLDEGSYLFMPTTMAHASIGEALEVIQMQDMAFRAIPEIDSVVGKLGRAETPLDPAPISMIETVISYKPQYVTDRSGHRVSFSFDPEPTDFFRDEEGTPLPAADGEPYVVKGKFARDPDGRLIPDPKGVPFRLWRPALDPVLNPGRDAWKGVRKPDDIWNAILEAGDIPGTTSAPTLQPIKARLVMLQSGMRAPMGVKIKGPDLESIERVGIDIERLLKQVPSVKAEAVIAERIVGKPYLEIDIDREACARFGVMIRKVQDVVEVAIGGKRVTTTVEGRERYPVRVRYMRELRDQIETLGTILVATPQGAQIPLSQLTEIRFVRGPQAIKSEDTFLVGYVLFDMKPGHAEVDVVEECARYLEQKLAEGEFSLPAGVSYVFAGNYENQLRATRTLMIVLPVALFLIFMILYLQFRSVPTTFLVFSGIFVAWAGGFILIWLYAQPWFLNFKVFGTDMQGLFQVHPINMSVAIWVGFLALFGIASDNGVVLATYLDQSFAKQPTRSIADIRDATVAGAVRRIRPCLMTSATTILALIPILTSTGRGADVMVPMAIPSFGGMLVVLVSVFVVPVLYGLIKEFRHHTGLGGGAVAAILLFTGVLPGFLILALTCAVIDIVRFVRGIAAPRAEAT